ncbi:hypothetical protein CEQ90_09855 [Lewinellaceae bacterium SD302]|nr:hypothetical protein CEQ90_09855 [Lewinellaceae bacterium SD302]
MNSVFKLFTATLLLMLLTTSCGESTPEETITIDPAKEHKELMIAFQELADPQTGLLDQTASTAYVERANNFSNQFPEDSLAALPLYRSAEISRSIGKPKEAIDTYKKVLERYPNFYKAAEARFMLAFSYDEDLKDLDQARVAYEDYLKRHPEHTFADDAQMLLRNLGKSDEEILQELEAQLNAAGN